MDGRRRRPGHAPLLGREPQGRFDVVVRDADGEPGRHPQRAVPRRRHADADAVLAGRADRGARRQPAGVGRRRPTGRGRDRPARRSPTPIAATPPSATRDRSPTRGRPGPDRRCRRHAPGREVPARPLRLAPRRRRRPGRPLGRRAASRRRARRRGRADVDVVQPTPGATSGSPSAPATLLATDLVDPDPPTPEQLTNAIGRRRRPPRRRAPRACPRSSTPTTSRRAATSRGTSPSSSSADRSSSPSVVLAATPPRTCSAPLATETARRAPAQPGPRPGPRRHRARRRAASLVAVMRRLHLDAVTIDAASSRRMACATRRSRSQLPGAAAPLRPPGHAAPAGAAATSPRGARCGAATRPG